MENGSFRLFKLWGIQVFLHWTWILVAFIALQMRAGLYSTPFWNVLEYCALFGIVLLHEFGHSLACRQVGGEANRIVLWPLGGIAFVNPPPRPGPLLWSIAAGPLVNVVLVPVLFGMILAAGAIGNPDFFFFVYALSTINIVLLVFNLLPIYPLDGGQIVRALLWFVIGRSKSITVASGLGVIGAIVGFAAAVALWGWSWWLLIIAIFAISQCIRGFQEGKILSRLDTASRHEEFACPGCKASPLQGEFWRCGKCGERLDLFATNGGCPNCGARYETVSCPECHLPHSLTDWRKTAI